MRASLKWLALLLVPALLGAGAARAESVAIPAVSGSNVTWSMESPEVSGKPGETVNVRIKGLIPKGWHTASLKTYPKFGPPTTTIELLTKESAEISGGIASEPAPKVDAKLTKVYGYDVEIFTEQVVFLVPVKISEKAALPLNLKFKVGSRICDENQCKAPAEFELPVTIKPKEKAEARPRATSTAAEVSWNLPDNEKRITANPGELITFHLKAMIDPDWHVYPSGKQGENIPETKFQFLRIDGFKDGKPVYKPIGEVAGTITYDKKPIVERSEVDNQDVQFFEDAVTFVVPAKIAELCAGENVVTIKVIGQVCKVGLCKMYTAEADIIVDSTVAASCPASMTFNTKSEDSGLLKEGLAAFLWAAVIGGLVSLLTPCVFPMIPITVSFFTKRKHISHAHAVADAAIFSLGIILTYVVVGVVLALALGRDARDFANNPWVNLGIFALFMVMAFSLLGFYELQLPTGLINKLNASAHGGQSKFGLMLMGLVFTLTSFSCTGPFVGSVMAAALKGNWLWPMLGMTVFATVFALPFFFLAIFPSLLKTLPKSGSWMNSVKVVMGLIEMAAALKFLSSTDLVWHWELLTRPIFVGIWLALALTAVVYLLGWIKFPHDTKLKGRSAMRLGFCTLFLAAAGFLIADLAGYKGALGFFAQYPPSNPYPPSTTEVWESGLAAARKQCKPVFFDFTGFNCVNCRRMEDEVFSRNDVEALLKNFVVVRLYTDAEKPVDLKQRSEKNMQTLLDKYNVSAVPFYAIVSPDGTRITEFAKGYTSDIPEFKSFLAKGASGKVTGCDLASTPQQPASATLVRGAE